MHVRRLKLSSVAVIVSLLFPLIASANISVQPGITISRQLRAQASQGEVTFWVMLRDKADLKPANRIKNWKDRGEFVVNQLQGVANRSQGAIRSLLKSKGKKHEPFWIANVIKVTADQATLDELAARPEVLGIQEDEIIPLPEITPAKEEATINGVEWGIDRIKADDVWSQFNVRGEGIVIANIDSGVRHNHPALVQQYRGNVGGTFDHNYNWYDPANACNNGRTVPCDNNGHGTHTMGTIVGSDGSTNQIGVAPGAKWIAAKGCESSRCSTSSLLASGQWVIAPTRLDGTDPDASKRPNIVNNSWGSNNGSNTFFQATIQAWVAAGIFPVFSNGNNGPACGTAGSPASAPEAYGVGAFDINNAIASFSSRGASPLGGIVKPNIAAPGVNIRSAWNDGSYNSINGTSMAAPHLSGAIALMWSAAPSLIGDIAATRALLDQTAIDTSDLACGGTAANNNVWGQGKLDALAAVTQAPRGPTGTLAGGVTSNGASLAGVKIDAVQQDGPILRFATTNSNGQYSLLLPVGTYTLTTSKFGYIGQTTTVTVTENTTTIQNFALDAAPSFTVSGTVKTTFNESVSNALVTIRDTPIAPVLTDANGYYSFASVPVGAYQISVTGGGCATGQTQPLTVDSDEIVNFSLTPPKDSFGYYCRIANYNYIQANTVLPLTGDDANVRVELPFPFTFYGQSYLSAFVATNGYLNFLVGNNVLLNTAIPNTNTPNGAIYPFWDDLFVDSSASVRTEALGTAPYRQFVIEWRNVRPFGDSTRRMDFEVVLFENGKILTQYRNIANDGREQGSSATLGIENATGTVALQYSFNQPVIREGLAIEYRLPPQAFLTGTVTDANDTQPVVGARVIVKDSTGKVVQDLTTDASGGYSALVPIGNYTIDVAATNYTPASGSVSLTPDDEDTNVVTNFSLQTARAEAAPASFEFLLPPSGNPTTRSANLTLTNTGSAGMEWSITSAAAWLTIGTAGGSLPAGGSQPIKVTVARGSLSAGVYDSALTVTSNSGRKPTFTVPVRLVVSQYQQGLNAGGSLFSAQSGDEWAADQAYTVGNWGYTSKSSTTSTRADIADTTEDALYQQARRSQVEYRFDNVPAGVYQIELRFAEIQGARKGQRVFDVAAESQTLLLGFDIMSEVGANKANDKIFFVPVSDGQLNLRFLTRRGFGEPIINAIRVTQRPDK